MRTKIIVALLLAVILVCSVSALAAMSDLSPLAQDWFIALTTGGTHVDPYTSDFGNQYTQHLLITTNYSLAEIELARDQAVLEVNAEYGSNFAPLTTPELGDDSIPLSLLAGLAALALGGAVFAHRRCKQC